MLTRSSYHADHTLFYIHTNDLLHIMKVSWWDSIATHRKYCILFISDTACQSQILIYSIHIKSFFALASRPLLLILILPWRLPTLPPLAFVFLLPFFLTSQFFLFLTYFCTLSLSALITAVLPHCLPTSEFCPAPCLIFKEPHLYSLPLHVTRSSPHPPPGLAFRVLVLRSRQLIK